MSEKTKTKSSLHKAHSNVIEKLQELVTATPELTDANTIPFPEWSDSDIIPFSPSTYGKVKEKIESSSEKAEQLDQFEDSQVMFLPFCLQDIEYDWKRPNDIFPEYEIIIFKEETELDFLQENTHLLHSMFMRNFISSIVILDYLSRNEGFSMEAPTKYMSNLTSQWKPWNHIYSGIKSGATQNAANKIGKYFIRLFWLGCWRKVVIDDYIPVDETGRVLLPSLPIPPRPTPPPTTQFANRFSVFNPALLKEAPRLTKVELIKEKPTVEIWPLLLCKALLKLANMTMNKSNDLVDFNIIPCLTGWILHTVDLKGIPSDDRWEICKMYTKLYAWQTEEAKQLPIADTKKKKKQKILSPDYNIDETKQSHYFVALCKDMRSLKSSAVHGLSPCWGHEIVIDECRDLPLEQPPPNEEFPLWKTFRWIDWAKSKGMIKDFIALDRTRYVKCLVPLRKPSKKEISRTKELKKTEGVPSTAKTKSNLTPRTDSGKSKKQKTPPDEIAPPKQSVWIKFDEISNYLEKFLIFFKASEFTHKARISDLDLNEIIKLNKPQAKSSPDSQKDSWQNVIWTKTIQKRRNVPLYFFTESLQNKIILIDISQAGDVERLVPYDDKMSETNFFVEYERLFGDVTVHNSKNPSPPKKLKIDRPKIHAPLKSTTLLLDRYRWDQAKTGAPAGFLSTYGNKSTLLELDGGRHIFRIWLKSEFSYCITILSDTKFSVGTLEQIMENISKEPMQITRLSLDIVDSFANLVNSFGTAEFPQRLKHYYKSYSPPNANDKLTKQQRSEIHEAFRNSILEYLEDNQDHFTVQRTTAALRTLFLDLTIHWSRGFTFQASLQEDFQFQSFREQMICNEASTKISAFLKGVQVVMLKNKHNVTNKKYQEIFDALKIVYSDIFSVENRIECFGKVLRNFFNHQNMIDFLSHYEVSKDFQWDVIVQTFNGNVELIRDVVVLCRYTLYCQNEVMICIHLFCSINNYVLRVINNDNDEEINRITGEVFPTCYKPNIYGYTVVGFAWSKSPKNIAWKLVFISRKQTKPSFIVDEIKSTMYMSFENYIPTCKDLISKYTISIRENVIVALRFVCSFTDVKFNIKLFDPDQKPIIDIFGTERIIIPSVLLKYGSTTPEWSVLTSNKTRSQKSLVRPKSFMKSDILRKDSQKVTKKGSLQTKKTREIIMDVWAEPSNEPIVYNLEIYVVDNSWPLTVNEWKIVRKLREDSYFINSLNTDSGSITTKEIEIPKVSSKLNRSASRKLESLKKPWYLLQYVFKTNTQAELLKNRKDEEEVYNLKKSWYEDDPDRYQRSLELRQNYLAKYTDPGCGCPDEYNIEIVPSESEIEKSETSDEIISEDDENTERSNKCPKWTDVNIPPFDLKPYYWPDCPCPIEFRKIFVKTEEDHLADQLERQRIIEEYNASIEKRRKDLELWMDDIRERRVIVYLWYEEVRKASEKVVCEYYATRKNLLDKNHSDQKASKQEKKTKKKK